jgi:hypothetical protein
LRHLDAGHKYNGKFGPTPVAAAFRFVQPTWRNYIQYVDLEAREGNADAKRYITTYQSLSARERNNHFPEQVCDLSNVQHADLISWVSRQVWIEGSARSSMVLSHMRDQVLQSTANYAMDSPDNVQHAKLFLSAAGALPQKTGRNPSPNVNIFNAPTATAGSLVSVRREESSPDVLPDMDTQIITLDRIMQTDDEPQTAAMKLRTKDDEEEEEEDDEEYDK